MNEHDIHKAENLEWNKEVIEYIENKKDLSLRGFIYFLKRSNLPLKIEWLYYCLGKTANNSCDKRDFFLSALKGEVEMEKLFPEIHLWDDYLLMEICKNKGNLVIRDINSESFIKERWQYVDDWIDQIAQEKASDMILDCQARGYEESGGGEYSSYCSSCNQSPCMCGDPDEHLNGYFDF